MRLLQLRLGTIVSGFALSLTLHAATFAADAVDYVRDVKTIFESRCNACHGALKQESNLRLDTAVSILRGGDGGPAVLARDASASELIYRVTADDESIRMPPEGHPLTDEQIQAITGWINEGARAPENEQPEDDPRQHWAFVQPVRVDIPSEGIPADWRRNPIDAILAAEHRSRGLTPLASAEKSIALRRLYLDLIGLPPSPQQIHEFRNDKRPDAWGRIVERLLASPAYGERWGRHWMDVWRYTDWYGLGAQVRNSQKHIWHWRDWIVESLNEDKGYDRMLKEMLAADEIAPTDLSTLRATGFLARNYYLFNRTTWLDGTIEHTSKAFLGLTVNCAKCHDHKYDPISQLDYYALRAIFEPHQIRHDTVPGEINLAIDSIPRAFDAHPNAVTHLHVRGDEKNPDTSRAIEPAFPAILDFAQMHCTEIELPPEAQYPVLRPFVVEDQLAVAARELTAAKAAYDRSQQAFQANADQPQTTGASAQSQNVAQLKLELARLRLAAAELRPLAIQAAHSADLAKSRDCDEAATQTLIAEAARSSAWHQLAQAQHDVAREELKVATAPDAAAKTKAAKALEAARAKLKSATKLAESPGHQYASFEASLKSLEGPDETDESRRQPYPSVSTGRRTALADWMTDRRNPLTARVAVNHVWTRHFGQPLVEPLNDFGRRTAAPPLQDLLDWLAVEFMEADWSMKHLHRLIVSSRAYRLSSDVGQSQGSTRELDPKNSYVWHRKPLRMESQVIRDSLLHLAGALDRRMSGPPIDPKSKSATRRSLYFRHSRDDRDKFVSMFDDADILRCYRRTESVVPQQALALANSATSHRAARALAERLHGQIDKHPAQDQPAAGSEFVHAAFEAVLSREPTAEETAECLHTYERALAQRSETPDPHVWARTVVVLALFNHNDFVTIR